MIVGHRGVRMRGRACCLMKCSRGLEGMLERLNRGFRQNNGTLHCDWGIRVLPRTLRICVYVHIWIGCVCCRNILDVLSTFLTLAFRVAACLYGHVGLWDVGSPLLSALRWKCHRCSIASLHVG